jgi:hypothetical protein
MPTSAIGPVFDYLLAGLPAVVTAVSPNASVQDGWVNDMTDQMVVLGTTPDAPDAQTSGTHLYQELGAGRVEEAFEIPAYVDCVVGGSVQAEARAAALVIFNAIVAFVRTDLTFGGALLNGRIGQLTNIRMDHTRDPVEAQAGRRCVIYFTISCHNLY